MAVHQQRRLLQVQVLRMLIVLVMVVVQMLVRLVRLVRQLVRQLVLRRRRVVVRMVRMVQIVRTLQHTLLGLLDDVHRLLDFALGGLVALRLRLDDRHRRVEDVYRAAIVLGALQLQCGGDALLLVELHQHAARRRRFGQTGVLHLAAAPREMVHHVVQLPVRQHVQHDNGATDLLDFARIIVGRQLRIRRQIVGGQLRIAGRHVLFILCVEFIYRLVDCIQTRPMIYILH